MRKLLAGISSLALGVFAIACAHDSQQPQTPRVQQTETTSGFSPYTAPTSPPASGTSYPPYGSSTWTSPYGTTGTSDQKSGPSSGTSNPSDIDSNKIGKDTWGTGGSSGMTDGGRVNDTSMQDGGR